MKGMLRQLAGVVSSAALAAGAALADEAGVIDSDRDRKELLGEAAEESSGDSTVPQDIRRASETLGKAAAERQESAEGPPPGPAPESVDQVVGKAALSREGSALGTISRVEPDEQGRMMAVLLLGRDGSEAAIPWDRLTLSGEDHVVVDMNMDQIGELQPIAR